ncbi:MAG: single-stranded DNA-binding protein [Caloramator sp.]|jgi:single-strand DNA-binding protein|uniref:single-stranded DNA-binding protein n=1 Tax=Caloramator sp. TaxID=1871330 RepID=UPI001D529A8B|nr:single-stranded DNA-binding protein [Caloramator sp.]MBZ4662795.1 single-stranded DNA-binding protein [Caloramator sp.]
MNKAILIGRLTKDPELKFTPSSGIAVANFTLAVDRNYTNQEGKREADFIPVICWRKLAENVANNLNKGRLVAVSGSIQTRKYQAQDGSTRYATEVVAEEVKFLDWPKNTQEKEQADFIEMHTNEPIPF